MPSRNIVREFAEHQYYHVYNRGVEKRTIFLDDQDYTVFLGLLKRYLGADELVVNKQGDKHRHAFPKISHEIQIQAYCLMPNHFHMLLYQTSKDGVHRLMRRVSTSYAMYFNSKYARVGGLFQGPYKASRINKDSYLQHVSRYIHLNPEDYKSWPYSSYKYFARDKVAPSWLDKDAVLKMFASRQEYIEFVDDYVAARDELSLLKWQLANDIEKGET